MLATLRYGEFEPAIVRGQMKGVFIAAEPR